MSDVRVRYAPSPTGIPHIGNIRTALFNFLLAKNKNGKFILRIEDTDQKRIIGGAVEKIEESLKVLGLIWDEKYKQSARLPLYNKHLEILKNKNLVIVDQGAWRFRVKSQSEKIGWDDVVHGPVEFTSDVIEDFVIVKSDGFPTYHLASVVDDHDMKISHVLRGDEWISSTPKHLMLYEAFSWEPPLFVHLPPILGPNHKKLSKREGAKSVLEYIDEGYLPEAIVNFLALLGWAPKDDRELFSLEELTREFSLERLNKNSPIFNLEKLKWFNIQWFKKLDGDDLTQRIYKRFPKYDRAVIKKLIPLVRERLTALDDFEKLAGFFFEAPKLSDIPAVAVKTSTVSHAADIFRQGKNWTADEIKQMIEQTAKECIEDRVATITAVRNIVSGRTVTPPLYESLEVLSKDETVRRLNEYLQKGAK